jgi:ArsR family transcriptional regulator
MIVQSGRTPAVLGDDQAIDDLTAVLKALAEPNRLRIMAALMEGDSCNCELQEVLDLAPNLLSHHLRVLEKARLVTSRRDRLDGRWVYYSVHQAEAARWQSWFAQFFDPARIQIRAVCGPEGQVVPLAAVADPD